MAQQDGIIKLNGKIGDLSFFKTKDGYQARSKGGVSAERIKTDPGFQRTRENNAEFSEVCSASKKIRDVLRGMILLTHDPKMATRLTGRVYKMMRADTENIRGERKVKPASFKVLKDFNFNETAPLNNTLFVTPAFSIDRVSGIVSLEIPAVIADVHLAKPKGATHYRITAGAALISLDEEVETSVLLMESSPYQLITKESLAETLTSNLPPNAVNPIGLVIGIGFYQEVNGLYYTLNNGAYNALCLVAVDTI